MPIVTLSGTNMNEVDTGERTEGARACSLSDDSLATQAKQQWAQVFVDELRTRYNHKYGTDCPPVRVHLSGRKARRRLGFYEVSTMSMTVNDGGMSDFGIRSTLVHEYAHHVHHTCCLHDGDSDGPDAGQPHGLNFRIHHRWLRQLAYAAGMLASLHEADEELGKAARKICRLRPRGGQYVLDVGGQLAAAQERCRAIAESFEVFLQDCVAIHRTTAYQYIRAFKLDLPPDLNFTTMIFLMRLKDEVLRHAAIKEALDGVPLEELRLRYGKTTARGVAVWPEDEVTRLLGEKRLLLRRLDEIERRLRELGEQGHRQVASVAPGHGT